MRKRLGDILVEEGVLSQSQLEEALTAARDAQMKLGEYLVSRNQVDEIRLVNILSRQLRVERYASSRFPAERHLTEILPKRLATKYRVVPLKAEEDEVSIGMVDPLDLDAIEAVEQYCRKEVHPVICTRAELEEVTGYVYGIGTQEEDSETEETEETRDVAEGELYLKDAGGQTSWQAMAETGGEEAAVNTLNWLINQALNQNASDIHISPEANYVHVRLRIDGRLKETPALGKDIQQSLVTRVKVLANMDISVSMTPQDGRFTVRGRKQDINIRVSSVPTVHGENLVLRLLYAQEGVFDLASTGVEAENLEVLEECIRKPHGMILTTGPTGSGKTTTLYTMLRKLNDPRDHIITLEDPVETHIEKVRQIQLNERAGMTFATGLRAILRQDPDIIMVGEIRDAETAQLATHAALTGHRVLSTLHTNSATDVVLRLMDMDVPAFVAASTLLVSVAQRLVRRVCPKCYSERTPTEYEIKEWELADPSDGTFVQANGCEHCANLGYKGRVGLFEVFRMDDELRSMILEQRTAWELRQKALEKGTLHELKEDARRKLRRGVTTFEEAQVSVAM